MAEILTADQLEGNLNGPDVQEKIPFRGVAIPINDKGGFGLELVGGVTPMEAYGAVSLVLEHLRKKFGMDK